MNMPKFGILTGILLILLGVVGFILGAMDTPEGEKPSLTAMIPAFAGLPILIFSLIGRKKLKLGMHGAAVFGLLGFLAPLGKLIPSIIKGGFELKLSYISMSLMALICGIFLFFCVKYFVDVRRKKNS